MLVLEASQELSVQPFTMDAAGLWLTGVVTGRLRGGLGQASTAAAGTIATGQSDWCRTV